MLPSLGSIVPFHTGTTGHGNIMRMSETKNPDGKTKQRLIKITFFGHLIYFKSDQSSQIEVVPALVSARMPWCRAA